MFVKRFGVLYGGYTAHVRSSKATARKKAEAIFLKRRPSLQLNRLNEEVVPTAHAVTNSFMITDSYYRKQVNYGGGGNIRVP
jgi:hypothetical protein